MKTGFTGIWIPAAVWLDERLTANEKILLAEVHSFTSREQDFYKANDTIAEFLHVSPSTVKRAIKNLTQLEYIERTSFDGRRRCIRSLMPIDLRPSSVAKKDTQPAQIEQAARPKRPKSSTKSKSLKETNEVKHHFDSLEWKEMWTRYTEYRKTAHRFKFASAMTEQAALDDLYEISNQNEQTAIAIIRQTFAKQWRGLFPLKGAAGKAGTPAATDLEKFRNYIETGDM